MSLDLDTLTLAGALAALSSGSFLLLHWIQHPKAVEAGLWAVAAGLTGFGVALLAFHASLPDFAAYFAAPMLLDLSAFLVWLAARRLRVGGIAALFASTSALLFLCAQACTIILSGGQAGKVFGAFASGCLFGAASIEVALIKAEDGRGRVVLATLLALEACSVSLTAVAFYTSASLITTSGLGLVGAVHFSELFFWAGGATCLILMLNQREEARHRFDALADYLTGLYNRRGFMEVARASLGKARAENRHPTMLAFDLDRFKSINDRFGHLVGDEVIASFGRMLATFVGKAGVAGRLGGEEFAVLLFSGGTTSAMALAGAVRRAFETEARTVCGHRVDATVSVGVAAVSNMLEPIEVALGQADVALYEAKRSGRNRTALSAGSRSAETVGEGNVRRLGWEEDGPAASSC